MNDIVEIEPDHWVLVVGRRAIRATMLTLITRVTEQGPILVLDGGNQFNVYLITRPLHGRADLLLRITVSRMFTCYQVLSALETMDAVSSPLVILDILHTFYDESVSFSERRRLLDRCIPHIARLCGPAGGAVSVHPPNAPTSAAQTLLATLQAAAPTVWIEEPPAQVMQPLRLF